MRDERSRRAAPHRQAAFDGPGAQAGRGGLSSLTRRIVVFNLVALNLLVLGVLYLGGGRDSPLTQYRERMGVEAALIGDVLEVDPVPLSPGAVAQRLEAITLSPGLELLVLAPDGSVLGKRSGDAGAQAQTSRTYVLDALEGFWRVFSGVFLGDRPLPEGQDPLGQARAMMGGLQPGAPLSRVAEGATGRFLTTLVAIAPQDRVLGAVALISPLSPLDAMARARQERALRIFALATLVSTLMSLLLASTIARPLTALATAAEVGGKRDPQRRAPARVRIPDMTARSDEIGRLSGALRGMVAALYERIESNEQFAADVAHEIKNPLASLRSAVGTLRMAKRDDHRATLLEVIEHDVRRLDRLVSDISNASRLDSELVREEEEAFDLLALLRSLTGYLGGQAEKQGIDFMTDLPEGEITLRGLEPRLAQVFVNLITNAMSFCQAGDAIRVWVRRRGARVLVVVEDTGPGIPEEALQKIFARFYSHRPASEFGTHSGLGLAISKQIVEAHGGVIWAENMRATGTDPTEGPLGARFVVGLPV